MPNKQQLIKAIAFAAALLSTVFLLPNIAQGQLSCGPALTGQPCAWGGIATQGASEPTSDMGVGNPIHLASGNKYQYEVDLPANRFEPLLEIGRHYNSLDPRQSAFGKGWNLSYETRLFYSGGQWQVVQADGSRLTLGPTPHAINNKHGYLQENAEGWLWHWPTGRQLQFNRHGQLIRITLAYPQQQSVSIYRHQSGPLQGAIDEIKTNHGQRLKFNYRQFGGSFYISAIESPIGKFRYRYGVSSANNSEFQLRAVIRPDGMAKRYLFDSRVQAGNTGLLTGIDVQSADSRYIQRLARWEYDQHGRAIRYRQNGATKPTLSLHYLSSASKNRPGLTKIVTADGAAITIPYFYKNNRYQLPQLRATQSKPITTNIEPPINHTKTRSASWLKSTPPNTRRIVATASTNTPGWPGLRIQFNPQNQISSWSSKATGTEARQYNKQGQVLERRFANGDQWHYRYNRFGQLKTVNAKNARSRHKQTIQWLNQHPSVIKNQFETEIRRYHQSQTNWLKQKTTVRWDPPGSRQPFVAHDRFQYNIDKQEVTHFLPEGGALSYRYNKNGLLQAISWLNREGMQQTVITSQPKQAGYFYGNGLHLRSYLYNGQAQLLTLSAANQTLWETFRLLDTKNQVVAESHTSHFNQAPYQNTHYYGYDEKARLVSARDHNTRWHYAWHADGSLHTQQINTHRLAPQIKKDASGLPTQINQRQLLYGPSRHLERVYENGRAIAVYRHNAFGHQIIQASRRSKTHYLYLENRVVAEAKQTTQNKAPSITRRYIYAGSTLVGLVDYNNKHPNGVLYAVHTDLIGTPRLITDAQQNVRWLANYTPTGLAEKVMGDLEFDLRFPGQRHDIATSWHDNIWRSYSPELGQYLEPDPLGPLPNSQAFGYAAQQPQRFIDPTGLLLFAFDGTRNAPSTQTNVWKMSQRYLDGPAHYHTGPGSPYSINWGAISGSGADQILENQWQWLLVQLEKTPPASQEIIPIDIIGYSRGAALARDFANRIVQHVNQGLFSYNHPLRGLITACVDLRFMGLFDTVSQFGLLGVDNGNYNFSIANEWAWVAHAVALQERRWLFPLTAATSSGQGNVIEAPFIGAHADIGGGLSVINRRNHEQGDLANVTLNWMIWQARAATVRFDDGPSADREITHAVIHDDRSQAARQLDTDRRIDAPEGHLLFESQGKHASLGKQQRDATEALINRYENWRNNGQRAVGLVDMEGYARWLHDVVGWQAPPS